MSCPSTRLLRTGHFVGALALSLSLGACSGDSWKEEALQPDGSVIIVGNFTAYKGVTRNRVARILPTGQLDTTFDPLQGANKEVFAVKLIEDGRVVITGSFDSFAGQASNGTMRLLPDGKCDPTINPSGLMVDSIQTTN